MNTNEGQPQYSPYAQPIQIQPPPPMNPQMIPLEPVVIDRPIKHTCDFCKKEFTLNKDLEFHYKQFHHNFLNCFSAGFLNCLAAFFGCSSCLAASARSDYDGSDCCFNFCCVPEPAVRNIIRRGYGIDGFCGEDMIVGVCCQPCNAIQLVAEVHERGQINGM